MATMAPDFVYAIVTEDNFDTKVNIALYPTTASIRLKMPNPNNEGELIDINDENWNYLGLTLQEWEAVQNYNGDIDTFTPFITSVTKHWYKDLDFSDCYVEAENAEGTADDDAFTSTYQYVGLGSDNDVLAGIANLYVEEVRKKDIFQVREPKVKKNELIKEMLLGGKKGAENTVEKYKYYVYNGSSIPEEGLKKQYIIDKVKLENGEEAMNTRYFTYAFAILEEVHSEDAEYILRDLKELFKDVGINVQELEDAKGGGEEAVKPLIWPIEGYKPIVWDPIYNAQTPKVTIKSKTATTLGFEEGMNVVMPANGKIVQIPEEKKSEGEVDFGDSVKIELTGTDRKELEGMYIYISGLKLDDSISEGLVLNSGTKIGTTIDRDITIIMTDKKRKAIYNVDEYIVPEDWEEETTGNINDSGFQGNELGNSQGGNTSVTTGSFSEEFYWYLATLEGMPTTSDAYFTSANNGVHWLGGEQGITVGPGIYMIWNTQRFNKYGYNFNSYDMSQIFPKDVTISIFKEIIEEKKQVIENYMQGYSLTQNQMEALVTTAYQRGDNDRTFRQILNYIKEGITGDELRSIWTYGSGDFANGKMNRRTSEWCLFSEGRYVDPYSGLEYRFTSNTNTPFTDMLNGIQSGHVY